MSATPDLRCPVCGGDFGHDGGVIYCHGLQCQAVWNLRGMVVRPSRLPDTERPDRETLRGRVERFYFSHYDDICREWNADEFASAVLALLETEGR